ncbi:MAG: hypothetical protein MUO63_09110, partial [Desulfobulbaceae bacterium]|nr:hypothetical protein [Desulfobulbaceae bacterium]
LPVVSRQDPNVLVGLISRSDILRAYQVGIMRKQQQYLMGERMALRLGDDIRFVELVIGKHSECVGKRLADLPLHQSTSIVAIRRLHEVVTPDSSSVFQEGDMLTIFCRTKHKEEILHMFDGVEIEAPKGASVMSTR